MKLILQSLHAREAHVAKRNNINMIPCTYTRAGICHMACMAMTLADVNVLKMIQYEKSIVGNWKDMVGSADEVGDNRQ